MVKNDPLQLISVLVVRLLALAAHGILKMQFVRSSSLGIIKPELHDAVDVKFAVLSLYKDQMAATLGSCMTTCAQ